ncbi:MAG: hypothetical protein WCJ40_00870 [Planctomycetota bacterium]
MSVSVHTWWPDSTIAHFLGAAHAGMEVETQQFGKQYVTWDSVGRSVAMPQLGFEKISYRGVDYTRNTKGIYHDTGGKPLSKYTEFNTIETLKTEITSSGQPSTTIIKEIILDHSGFEYGVDAEMIARWWNTKLKMEPGDPKRRFSTYSTEFNCVSIVMEGLLFGGLGCYAPIPKNWMYNSAKDLNRWVLAATSEITRLNNQNHDALIYQNIFRKAILFALGTEDLPKFEEWKSNSNKKIYNPLARRLQQVANIDQLIKEYHAIPPNTHEMNRESILLRIYNNAITHLTKKPNSDRRDAVLDIAIKALGIFLRKRKDKAYLDMHAYAAAMENAMAAEVRMSIGSDIGSFRSSSTSSKSDRESWGSDE